MKDKKHFSSFLFKYLKGQRKIIILLAIFFISNIVLQIVAPQILSFFIDSAKGGKTFGYISFIIVIYLITIIFNMVMSVGENYFSQSFGWKVTNKFRKEVLEHFLNIDMEYHEKWTSGEMMTRLDEDVEGLFSYFYMLIFKLVGSTFLMVGVLIVMATKSIVLSLSMLAYCIITVWIFKVIQDYGMKLYVRRSVAISKFNGFIKERIDNIIEIRTNSAEKYSLYKINEEMKKRFKESLPAGMMYSKLWSASTILNAVGTILSLGMATLLWEKGIITLGTVYLIFSYSALIYVPLQQFRNYLTKLQEAKAGLIRVKEMLDIDSKITEGDCEIENGNIKLSVNDLYFGYSEDKDVLYNISFELNSGERLGIMGETGCGKTTLAKLLARLYEFNRGEIMLNGISVKNLKEDNIHNIIAYCTQDVHLIHGTLRDNITLYNEKNSDKDILIAIERMGLKDWFKKFNEGLDTYLEMGENNLSAGEAQLISIIRLFLKNPSILILDEISSRLDYVTEQRVLSALDVLTENKTVITIAHKGSALRWTDRIMVLKDGKIAGYFNKEELEENNDEGFLRLFKAI